MKRESVSLACVPPAHFGSRLLTQLRAHSYFQFKFDFQGQMELGHDSLTRFDIVLKVKSSRSQIVSNGRHKKYFDLSWHL